VGQLQISGLGKVADRESGPPQFAKADRGCPRCRRLITHASMLFGSTTAEIVGRTRHALTLGDLAQLRWRVLRCAHTTIRVKHIDRETRKRRLRPRLRELF